ncbi:hypothetical protein R3P38DRAFT_3176503 [Favolaschia claudopus]|uniref:Uncharacterized protein n=1 Tax=Favolaschia claudopus TaxID=2862362 RepID=A0AAW0D6W4_9AGAR
MYTARGNVIAPSCHHDSSAVSTRPRAYTQRPENRRCIFASKSVGLFGNTQGEGNKRPFSRLTPGGSVRLGHIRQHPLLLHRRPFSFSLPFPSHPIPPPAARRHPHPPPAASPGVPQLPFVVPPYPAVQFLLARSPFSDIRTNMPARRSPAHTILRLHRSSPSSPPAPRLRKHLRSDTAQFSSAENTMPIPWTRRAGIHDSSRSLHVHGRIRSPAMYRPRACWSLVSAVPTRLDTEDGDVPFVFVTSPPSSRKLSPTPLRLTLLTLLILIQNTAPPLPGSRPLPVTMSVLGRYTGPRPIWRTGVSCPTAV